MLEHKAVPVNGVEVVDRELGIVSAIVSVTGIEDRVKDVIKPGAYTKTLRNRTPKGVWHHDMTKPVSKTLEIKELMPGDPELPTHLPDGTPWPAEAGALKVLTQFNLKSSRGRDAFADVEFFGADQEWSIGYRVPPGTSEMKGGVRYCSEMDLFEYSPVLFGAMPAARTIVSVKDAQESWGEVKSALFGACGDGEGTCCLSCGTKATHDNIEAKADEFPTRWVVDFHGAPPEGLESVVGTFGTKSQAEAWLGAFDPETAWEANVLPIEVKADALGDEAEFERFYTAIYTAVMEYAEDEDEATEGPGHEAAESPAEEAAEDGKAIPWREHAHPRDPGGRFSVALGRAIRATGSFAADVARDAHRPDHMSTRDLAADRRASASRAFKRWEHIGGRIDGKLADRDGRLPSEAAPRVIGALFAARHLAPGERADFKLGNHPDNFPADLPGDVRQMAFDWSNGNDKKYRRIMRVLPRAVDWLWDEPDLFTESRLPVRRPRVSPAFKDDDLDLLTLRVHGVVDRTLEHKDDDFYEEILDGVAALMDDSSVLTDEEKSLWAEGLHPRSGTGEFAPKNTQRQQARFGGKKKPGATGHDPIHGEVGKLTPYQRAQAAVYAADEAHKKKGPVEYAKWRRALAALFRGNRPIKPTGKPVDKKDDDVDLEFKRFVSGWDEAMHPRDARGRFTDSPGEAAMKQALQRAQSGVETAAEKLDRLLMDEGDVETMDMAYFDQEITRLPVDPNAPRYLTGNPGDLSFEATSPESRAMVDMALNDAIVANLNAQRSARVTDMKPDATLDLATLGSVMASASVMTNPDDRLQMGTNFMSGKDIVKAYDNVQADLARPRGNKRKRQNAKIISEALQTSMIGTFGQGWKKRLSNLGGPDREEFLKSERNRRIIDRVALGGAAAVYGTLIAAAVMMGKADDGDLESFLAATDPEIPDEPLDPVDEGEVEDLELADADAEERREIEDKPVNNILVADGVYDELFSFNTAMVDPDAPPTEESEDFATFLYYVAHPEEEAEAGAGEEEPPAEEQPVEGEEEPPAPEAKADEWAEVDQVLDFYFNEAPKSLGEIFSFELADEMEAKADDPDLADYDDDEDAAAFEDFLDDFYGALQDGTDEEVDAKFDSNLHPRGRDGKFAKRSGGAALGKVGGAIRSANRGLAYTNKIIPGRDKIAKRSYSGRQKSAWRRERIAAKLQGRRPSRSMAKFIAAAYSSNWLPPDERQAHLDNIGVSLNDIRRNIRRDLKSGGSSPMRQKRIEKRVQTLSDNFFRTEKAQELWDLEVKAAELDAEIAEWDEDYVFDLMAKMSPEELEALIEGIESKGVVSEATGGKVADPGKGNQGNIKPIMRWFERGEGAAKIRWGTKGDFMRCVHLAEKHMNPEFARGFCNKRHVAVLGNAPGQGPHAGAPKFKKKDDGELEACLLCARPLDVKDVCTGCGTDYLEFKGARHFMESMVKRAGDGKFASKPGRNLGLTAGAAGGSPNAKKPKKSLKQRAVGGIVKHPIKTGIAVGAARAGVKQHQKKKIAQAGGAAAGAAAAKAGGGRGPSGSWVDTLDVLADMAGDRDSLLNHMVDQGMAKVKNGEPLIDLHMSDHVSGAKLKIAGKYDALQLRRATVIAKAVDRFNRPGLTEGGDKPIVARIAETAIDMDASTISVWNDKGDKRDIPFDRSSEFLAALDASSARGEPVHASANIEHGPTKKPANETDGYVAKRAAERGVSEDEVRRGVIDSRTQSYQAAQDLGDPAEIQRTRERLAEARGVSPDEVAAEDRLAFAERVLNSFPEDPQLQQMAKARRRDLADAQANAKDPEGAPLRAAKAKMDDATAELVMAKRDLRKVSQSSPADDPYRQELERVVASLEGQVDDALGNLEKLKGAKKGRRRGRKDDGDLILSKDEVDLLRIAARRIAL